MIAPIFNHLLASRLSREGFQNGVSAPCLDAQFHEMKGGGGGHEVYARICSLTEDAINTEYRVLLRDIDLAIRTLRLRPRCNLGIPKSSTNRRGKPPKSKLPRTNLVPEPYIIDASSQAETIPNHVRPQLQQYLHRDHRSPYFPHGETTNDSTKSQPLITLDENDIISPMPRIYTDINGNPALARPLLLFRSTEKVDVFRSRCYEDPNKPVPQPSEFKSKEYEQDAWPHLQRDKKYSSPFISFGQSAVDVIGRLEIARSEDFDTKKFLAIFSFNGLEADAAQNFGPGSGPHLVRGLFSKHESSDLPKGYRGGGEWLVWGYISCEPLVVLDSAQAISLAKGIRKFKAGDIAALADVSKSLKDVPPEWKEAVSYVILNNFCKSKLPRVGTPAYKELMEVIISGRRVTFMAEPIDLSRLSVHDGLSDDDDDDTEEISLPPPRQRLELNQVTHRTVQPVSSAATTGSLVAPTDRVTSVIRNLNFLSSRSARGEIQPNTLEATPFWSPDPPESFHTEAEIRQPTQNHAKASPLPKVVNLDVDEEEDDWELINADLEKSFAKSFPSASKRICNIKPVNNPQANSNMDFDIEGKDYVVPSIEKDHAYNDENSYNRGNFLRGLTQFAVSASPPLIETPSRMPRNPVSSRILQPYDDNSTPGSERQQVISGTPRFRPYQALTKRIQNPVSEQSGLARVTSRNDRGGKGTMAKNMCSSTSTFNSSPETNVRTKVPVIVRKRIVDY